MNAPTASRFAPRFLPELAALVATLPLVGADLLLLTRAHAPLRVLATTSATLLLSGALLALLWRGIATVTRPLHPRPRAHALATAAPAIPAILLVARHLFSGTGISRHAWAAWAPFVLAPILFAFLVLGILLVTRIAGALRSPQGRRRLPVALALALLGGALAWADATLYPNQYAYLHWVLLAAEAASGLGIGALLFAEGPTRPWHRLAPLLFGASLPLTLVLASTGLQSQRDQQLLEENAFTASRIVRFIRRVSDRDGDGYATLFGGHDCDDGDAAIHPFAIDRPGNGVDEDCDGADGADGADGIALPPTRSKPQPKHPDTAKTGTAKTSTARPTRPLLSEAAYREALTSWRSQPPSATALARLRGANILLLVVDALRADELYGCIDRGACPALKKLAHAPGTTLFPRTYSHGAGTDIGMSTLLTGHQNAFGRYYPTLAEELTRAGYHTYAAYPREVERWLGKVLSPKRGLQNRDIIINDPWRENFGSQETSTAISDRGIAYLRRHAKGRSTSSDPLPPFFVWLHYFDVHERHDLRSSSYLKGVPAGRPAYRALLHHVDAQIGRVLDALARSPDATHTLIVFTADHGEGLADTPRLPRFHGDVLYEPLVRVPLIIHLPPGGASSPPPGKRRLQVVSLTDIAPTLLDLVGAPAPKMSGISLAPFLLSSGTPPWTIERPLALYEEKQRGLLVWPFKLLVWKRRGLVELYRLDRDPQEKNNLVDTQAARTKAMIRRLARHRIPEINRRVKKSS